MKDFNERHPLDTGKMYRCTCTTHGIVVSGWHFDENADAPFESIEVGFWEAGTTGPRVGLWRRLKNAWKVLVHGSLEAGDVVLTREDAKEMGEQLIRMAEHGNQA